MGVPSFKAVRGRGAFVAGRSRTVRGGGLQRSAYVGISNDKAGEKPARRKPKVSSAMFIS